MPAQGKSKGRAPRTPRVPVTGGWSAAHGMGLGPDSSNRNLVQSRLRPRVTKNVANTIVVTAQTKSAQFAPDDSKADQKGEENELDAEAASSEIVTTEPPRKRTRTARASQSFDVDVKVKVSVEETKDVQIKTEVTADVVEEGVRGTKRKRTKRVVIAVAGRTAYEAYVKIGWRTTPYPDFTGPSSEDCEKVCALLEEQHGHCPRPKEIPPPSVDVAGCGQVRQVIDAIVRTVISANTTFESADKAIRRLHDSFGTITNNLHLSSDEYPGLHHCLDYNKIRSASVKEVADAVEPSGSHFKKAGWIKALLDGTYNINAERAGAFRNETPDNPARVLAADKLSDKQKKFEIWMFDNGILHLEHYRALSNQDAMSELVTWKGVAVKTAACVLLFCMQQPVFALDTHCLRLASWLGWIPHDAEPEEAFAHLDAVVPDDLKYTLHQLFIRHGQVCLKCKKESNEGSAGWADCVCPLEGLLKRTGKEKPPPKPKMEKLEAAHADKDEEGRTKVARPKRGRKSREEEGYDGDDDKDEDDDHDYKGPSKKRAYKPREKATEAVPRRRGTRNRKSADDGTSLKGIQEEEVVLKPADIDVTEALLSPEKHKEMTLDVDVDGDSSELSEHSDSEFVEYGSS